MPVKTDEVPQENKSENCGGCIIMMMIVTEAIELGSASVCTPNFSRV